MRHLMMISMLLSATSVAQAQQTPSFDVAVLIEALAHRDDSVREKAAQLLLRDDVAAKDALVAAMHDLRPMLALRAGVILQGRIDAQQAAADVAAILNDDATPPWRWYMAAFVLGNLDPEAAKAELPTLIAALAGPHPFKQYAAVQAIYRIGPEASAAESALWAMLERGVPKFYGVYLDRDAIIIDDDLSYTDAIAVYERPFRLRIDEQEDRDVVYLREDLFVLDTLHRIGAEPQRLEAPLMKLADVSDPLLRVDAARQLARLSETARMKAAAVLVELITDSQRWARQQAVAVLGRMGPQVHELPKPSADAIGPDDALAGLLGSDDQELRQSAAAALKSIEPRSQNAKQAQQRYGRFEALLEYQP